MLLREAFAPLLTARKIRIAGKAYKWEPKLWQVLGMIAGVCFGLWGTVVLVLGLVGGTK